MRAGPRSQRYHPFVPLAMPDRTWPDRTLTRSPRWLSTDLRDGNQALAAPMSPARKLALFELLVAMGYREIEVGFPVASQDEHDFVRLLIEQDRIPDDVRISVLVPARDELIRRTVQALDGAASATVHVYNATAPLFRELVYAMDRDECRNLAVQGVRWMMKYAELVPGGSRLGLEYSQEAFTDTEPEFALEVCEAVLDVWQPEADRELILNFPSTVERSLPHVFADQIEWLDRNLSHREHVCLSVHPHNDRGTGVAATELALLAGAQRVEGCLFGGGERAGNVCLVTLGLNLLTQGVDPGIDFSDLGKVRAVVESCTGLPVPQRHPYAGDLVFTAFSGAHQDAIKKGFDAQARTAARTGTEPGELPWQIPYLPMDPKDVGRDYEAVVRINSQSGKGGVAYVMAAWHGLNLPRGLRIEFARVVQEATEAAGCEMTPDRLRTLFDQEYLLPDDYSAPSPTHCPVPLTVRLYVDGGTDGGTEDALEAAHLETALAPWDIEVCDVVRIETAGTGGALGADVITVYAEHHAEGTSHWGVGTGPDAVTAALAATRAAGRRGTGRTSAMTGATETTWATS
ncbi:2-isopropylmalate synthase [Catenulispora yoronensis]|uniref:2-isopropylmalate synthase n=1 Tax=Catenulispora yoronensis TaxID=450799 RepID=A0ABN2ULU7_9ACTN